MIGVRMVAAARTAVVPRGGPFAGLSIHDLGAPIIAHLLAQTGIDPRLVDEVIAGNALGAGGNPARRVALAAGLPEEVGGISLDRQCCGGLDALRIGAALIGSGMAQVVIAGGVESYSRRPMRAEIKPDGTTLPYDHPPFTPWPERDPEMAAAAQTLAGRCGISRARQEEWAIASHAKALASRDRLRGEIVVLNGVPADPFARNMSPALCARAARITGDITRATTAVAADAAAFCVLMSDPMAKTLGLTGLAYRAGASLGGDPEMPGLAPVAAIARSLALAGVQAQDLRAAEVMEAFAVQAIACVECAGLNPAVVNLGGGALARGHPIGASGAVLAVRLFHEMNGQAEPHGFGVAAIAAAGGLGSAVVLGD